MSEVGGVEFGRGDNPLDFLVEAEDEIEHSWEWAVVTGNDPLRIRFENEPNALNMTPDSLIPAPPVGTRVRVVIYGRNVLIVGAARGGLAGDGPGVFVPWEIPGRKIGIETGSSQEPVVELRRDFSDYVASAYFYVANSSSSQGAIMIRNDGENKAALRINEDASLQVSDYDQGGTRPIPYAVAAGRVTLTNNSAGTANATVTFPSGRFTVAPSVVVTPETTGANTRAASVYSISASSMRVYMYSNNAATITVDWQAVQMTPTSVSG